MFLWPLIKDEVKEEVKESAREGVKEGMLSLKDVLVEAMKEAVKEGVEGVREDIKGLPQRMVDYLTEKIYGEETVEWGQIILSAELEEAGYKPVDTRSMPPKERRWFVGKVKEIKGKSRGMESSVDEVLVYDAPDDKRYVFLVEGKHKLSEENLEDAQDQIKLALGRLKNLGLDWIPIPVFVFYTKSDATSIEEYMEDIKKWAKDVGVESVKVILPSGEVITMSGGNRKGRRR